MNFFSGFGGGGFSFGGRGGHDEDDCTLPPIQKLMRKLITLNSMKSSKSKRRPVKIKLKKDIKRWL